jgi:hypothetical protein
LVFTFLQSYWSEFTFFIVNVDSRIYADISCHLMKLPKWCTMRVYDVVGKSVIYYPHHGGA